MLLPDAPEDTIIYRHSTVGQFSREESWYHQKVLCPSLEIQNPEGTLSEHCDVFTAMTGGGRS